MTNKQLAGIEKLAKNLQGSADSQHGYKHVNQVRINAITIIRLLKPKEKIDVDVLQTACLLHDITYSKHKRGLITMYREAKLAGKLLAPVLEKLDIDAGEKKIIHKAIVNHPLSAPFKHLNRDGDVYSKILQDADTLDLFTEDRLESFKNSYHPKSLKRKLVRKFNARYQNYMRKHVANYLNFPELSKHLEDFGHK